MKALRIAIVDCGNMGLAFACSFLHYNLLARPDLLLVACPNELLANVASKGTTTEATLRELRAGGLASE